MQPLELLITNFKYNYFVTTQPHSSSPQHTMKKLPPLHTFTHSVYAKKTPSHVYHKWAPTTSISTGSGASLLPLLRKLPGGRAGLLADSAIPHTVPEPAPGVAVPEVVSGGQAAVVGAFARRVSRLCTSCFG